MHGYVLRAIIGFTFMFSVASCNHDDSGNATPLNPSVSEEQSNADSSASPLGEPDSSASCSGEDEADSTALQSEKVRWVLSADLLPTTDPRNFVQKSTLGRMNGIGLREEYKDTVAQIISDTLILRVSHADGCQDHSFTLFFLKDSERHNVALAFLHYESIPWEEPSICYAQTTRWIRFALIGVREKVESIGAVTIEGFPEKLLDGSGQTYAPFHVKY